MSEYNFSFLPFVTTGMNPEDMLSDVRQRKTNTPLICEIFKRHRHKQTKKKKEKILI